MVTRTSPVGSTSYHASQTQRKVTVSKVRYWDRCTRQYLFVCHIHSHGPCEVAVPYDIFQVMGPGKLHGKQRQVLDLVSLFHEFGHVATYRKGVRSVSVVADEILCWHYAFKCCKFKNSKQWQAVLGFAHNCVCTYLNRELTDYGRTITPEKVMRMLAQF